MEHKHSSTFHGFCWPLGYAPDVAVVIGAGPEGLKAAQTLVTCGLKVKEVDLLMEQSCGLAITE